MQRVGNHHTAKAQLGTQPDAPGLRFGKGRKEGFGTLGGTVQQHAACGKALIRCVRKAREAIPALKVIAARNLMNRLKRLNRFALYIGNARHIYQQIRPLGLG